MAIHTFRYRFTAEVEITVDDAKAAQRQPEEIAALMLEEHGDHLIDCDRHGILGKEELYRGVTGEVVKIPTWDRI